MFRTLCVAGAVVVVIALAGSGCGEPRSSVDEVQVAKNPLSTSGEVDPLHPTSENKPTPQGTAAKIAAPSGQAFDEYVMKQQLYLQTVQVKLATEWKGLDEDQIRKAKAELKRTMLEVQP